MSLTLRPYQSQAISDLRNAYRAGAQAPLLVGPTGMGKTVILAEILRSLSERGRTGLVLVHRRELIAQTARKLKQAGVAHGVIAAGFSGASAPIQIASVQTLTRRLQTIAASPGLIVIDEAHHATAGSWSRVLSHWPDALRLGVTATPIRLDGRGLSAVFDRLVLGPSVADLVAHGYLTPARIYAPPIAANMTGLRQRAGDYAIDDAAAAMDRPTVTGDAIEHFRRLASDQRAITFCCSTTHAEHVCESFKAAGINAATLLGSTDAIVRDQVVADFAAGILQVLVTVDVVSEGFDVPAAGCAILLRPTASLGLYLQQIGRVLRPAPGKQAAIILDHVGNVHRHGFPDDHRDWSLEGIQRARRGVGPAAPSVRTCEQCFAAFKPAPICPCCGHECAPKARELHQVDGELRELKRKLRQGDKISVRDYEGTENGWINGWAFVGVYDKYKTLPECEQFARCLDPQGNKWKVALQDIKPDPRAQRRAQGSARTLSELLAIAAQRGYSPAWAYKVHNARNRHP